MRMAGDKMAKYRKKPVVVEAFQWMGGCNQEDAPEWIIKAINDDSVCLEDIGLPEVRLCIKTLEGTMQASVGDYIIQGVDGELYPCKPYIFEKTYEKVVD